MNILVVGGAGYIGSHTTYFLQKSGHNPIVYDNLSKGYLEAVKILNAKFYEGDLADQEAVREVLRKEKIDAVMHFAAFIEVGESVHKPSKYYHNNVAKVLNLLDVMVESGIKYFVFSSTAATFGEPQCEKVSEEHPQKPINPYGQSKLMVEKILTDYDLAYGLKSVILRYFNAAGCDPEGLIGGSYKPVSLLIPRVLMAASGILPEITIFGDDYPTPDGTCIRDFIHVNDLANAHLLGLGRMIETNHSDNFNLGSGTGFSVKEIINSAQKLTAREIPTRIAQRRAGDPSILVADPTKAERVLNWKPEYGLDAIVSSAWKWEQNPKY